MLALVTMPDATTFLTAVGAWSAPVITDLLPIVYYAIGITLAFAVPGLIIAWVSGAFNKHH